MIDHIKVLLGKRGYVNSSSENLYFRETSNHIYIIRLLVDDEEEVKNHYIYLDEEIKYMLDMDDSKCCSILNIFIVKDDNFGGYIRSLIEEVNNIWVISRKTRNVFIFENQPNDFDNLHDDLVNHLYVSKKILKDSFVQPVNAMLVIINILYFCYYRFSYGAGIFDNLDQMLDLGALNYESFITGKWYQLFSSLFIHFSFSHLIGNMILLYYVGNILEKEIGSFKYFFAYFMTGFAGNLISVIYTQIKGEFVVSGGASGSIFGIIGILIILLALGNRKIKEISAMRLCALSILIIAQGFFEIGINNSAHIGSLIVGLFIGLLLSKKLQYVKLE